ncbi:MAG: FAD-binding protein, partial [Alphaproteobacteria bacterium]
YAGGDAILPSKVKEILTIADTIEELAEKVGVDVAGLKDTIAKNNEYAAAGHDPDYHRGESFYDQYYGDQRHGPNKCIAPIVEAPFYCIPVYPGDIGTKGGLLVDEKSRVLREDGSVIGGLYAIGNTSASVMGRTYPGAGVTIGPAMTFGYVAARDAVGIN